MHKPAHYPELERNAALPDHSKMVSQAFWATIFVLIGTTLIVAAAGFLRAPKPAPTAYEIPATALERALSNAAGKAQEIVAVDIGLILDKAYEPAYAAITDYADFHYSLRGEYIELSAFATGALGEQLNARLLDGLEQRLSKAVQLIDQQYADTYRDILQADIASLIPPEHADQPLGDTTQALLRDAQTRVVASPLASATSGLVVGRSLTLAFSAAGKKLATQLAAKTAAKSAAKGGAALTGAGASALACAWSGPFAVACGVIGGAVTWVLVDSTVIRIDEYLNREEFEAQLRAMLDKDKAARQLVLEQMLTRKAAEMDAAAKEMMKAFTLRELDVTQPSKAR